MKSLFLIFIAILYSNITWSQQPEITPPAYIKTIQFEGGTEFSGTPIVKLGESIRISFDDLIGDEADYYYKITHYNFDWTPSDLSKNEYMEGYDNMRIINYLNSYNTLQIYSHYWLEIPNKNTKRLKVSGNYMLEIYNNKDEIVFSRKFMVYEDIAKIATEIKRTRDLKYIDQKQAIYFSIDGSDNLLIRNPDSNLKTLIIKNNNLQESIYNLKPQYNTGNKFIYRYDKEASFWGGNEFLAFDTKDVRGTAMNIRKIELIDIYNTYLYANASRAHEPYTYNPDINGSYVIRTLQGENNNIEAEYTWVHFNLLNPYNIPEDAEIHLYGSFNNYTIDDSTKLTYNKKTDSYQLKHLFKQGFYNYKYILVNKDGSIDHGAISGNFDKTENNYTVLAYYRDLGGRYDRIIGVGSASSKNISN